MAKETDLLTEIEAFLKETGISASYFGKKYFNNSELVSRLRAGRTTFVSTEKRVRETIKAERKRREIA
jgi:hypothetical protein